jgi:hypothetical protein
VSADAVTLEVRRLEGDAKYAEQSQFGSSKLWGSVNRLLGVPAAGLAALAGGAGLASAANRVFAGVVALVGAALGAILTAIGASRRAAQAKESGNAYLQIRTRGRQRLSIVAGNHQEAIRQRLTVDGDEFPAYG